MFADLGHFTASSIRVRACSLTKFYASNLRDFITLLFFCTQLAFAFVIYPCLVMQYMGQAAFLSKNLESVHNSFYDSIPG